MGSQRCFFLGVLLLAACAGDPEPVPATDQPVEVANPLADSARRAMRIELNLDAYRRVSGAWTGSVRNTFTTDDASSTFTAYFEANTLRLIEEDLDLGEVGAATNVYYFEEGALFYAVQDERRARRGQGGVAQSDPVRLRVSFDQSGSVMASEQMAEGFAEPVPVAKVDGVRRHAAALRDEAEAARRAL